MVLERTTFGKSKCMKDKQTLAKAIKKRFTKYNEMESDLTIWDQHLNIEGLVIWVISELECKLIKPTKHGYFFDSNAYLILSKNKQDNLDIYEIYTWIGLHASCEQYCFACWKLGELFRHLLSLGFPAMQHIEYHTKESKFFLRLFPKLVILKGCYSAFKDDSNEDLTRMLRITKLHKCYKIQQISCRRENIFDNDVYIIEKGKKLYQLNGTKSEELERVKASEIVEYVKMFKPIEEVEVIDFSDETSHPIIDAMPMKETSTVVCRKISLLKVQSQAPRRIKSAWRVIHYEDSVHFSLLCENVLHKYKLVQCSGNRLIMPVCILDLNNTIVVWTGSLVEPDERLWGIQYAMMYKELRHIRHVPVVVAQEGGYNDAFMKHFTQ